MAAAAGFEPTLPESKSGVLTTGPSGLSSLARPECVGDKPNDQGVVAASVALHLRRFFMEGYGIPRPCAVGVEFYARAPNRDRVREQWLRLYPHIRKMVDADYDVVAVIHGSPIILRQRHRPQDFACPWIDLEAQAVLDDRC